MSFTYIDIIYIQSFAFRRTKRSKSPSLRPGITEIQTIFVGAHTRKIVARSHPCRLVIYSNAAMLLYTWIMPLPFAYLPTLGVW